MLFVRTFSVKMNGARFWLAVVLLQTLASTATCGSHHHRRSTGGQSNHPLSKGGWRPVVGSGGLLYGSFGTAPLHAQAYKIPVPVLDLYQSSSRPLVARDAAKLTSIAQSYRPTTLRTVPSSPTIQNANQPINSYHNPFAIQNNGLSQFKYVQNFPVDSSFFRNTHNPYAARPVSFKYQTKYKQPLQNNMLQQLTNIQPVQFGQYNVNKPLDLFGKPIETYVRPDNKKQQSAGTEIFKPQVFELLDSDTASQSVSQQVKTAQQQSHVGTPKSPVLYPQYSFQDALFPSILGSFGSFGVQSVKGRDPVFPATKTTYLPPSPTKQTIFNSFGYATNYKTTPGIFSTTTPKLQTTANQLNFASNYNDFKITPTQSTKLSTPYKIDPNAGSKGTFKPSPQDPFIKHYQSDFNKITTYNPIIQTTTLASNYFDYSYPSQQNAQIQNYFDQQNYNNNYENKKQKIHDSVAAGGNQQVTKQYTNPQNNIESGPQNSLHRPTYEVTETTESEDVNAHTSPSWALTSQSYDYNQQSTQEPTKKAEYTESAFSKPNTTPLTELPEEYAIVTEAEKGYENSFGYDGQVESQSRRPLGDDFEPIGKHKLKDYYYRVSTPTYDDYSTSRRTKKPSEATRLTTHPESTTPLFNDIPIETLPTLPPNRHFKRPSATEPVDKDKIRKRNKNRRRRPPLANINRNRDETSTHAPPQSTESSLTTNAEEIYTIRPRVKTTKSSQATITTPSVTTDLTTSALPTISPTAPTIIKKNLSQRRPLTTNSYRFETTTQPTKDYDTKDSQIMKIANRPHFPKLTSTPYEYKTVETPDYTHKQDEKDTPTSDISVSLSDSLQATAETEQDFSFHKDVKPIEAKLEPVTNTYRDTTTDTDITNEVTTATSPVDTTTNNDRQQRPRLRNKYNNRSRFSVKDYRSRLSSTTSTTEKTVENTPKVRFPHRRIPNQDNENENTTERKKFTPKDPRYKINNAEGNETTEKEVHPYRQSSRQRQPTVETIEGSTQKISSRIRNGQRKPKPEETTETTNPTTVHSKRPLRKKIKDSELGESVQDISVTDTTVNYDHKNDITSERTRSESAIMKIADKKHHDHVENLYEHSKRVSDLTLAASKDYNKPGMFKTVATNSRRIPNYFTIATDDPILPIEAFFPQLNQKKES